MRNGIGAIQRRLTRPWLQAAGVVVYPLPWLVFVQRMDGSWGPVLVGGWVLFALYLAVGIAELAVGWGHAHGRQLGAAVGRVRSLGWQDKARRRVVPATVTPLSGRHRAEAVEAERQVVRPQHVGRHRAPGRHALRSTPSVAGGHRAA